MWNIPPGVCWPCLTEECPDTVCTTFKHCFKATAVNFRYIYACFNCWPLPFPVKMSHCVCVYTCICVCVRKCAVSSVTALGVSHSLPPSDEIQMETFSGQPTLLTIMAPQIFYFLFLSTSLSNTFAQRWTHSDYSPLALPALLSLKRARELFYMPLNIAVSCRRLSFSHICATCSLPHINSLRVAHIKRRRNTFFFVCLTPRRFIRTSQTRSEDPLKSRIFH